MVPLILQNPLLEGLLRYVSKVRDTGLKTAVFCLQAYLPNHFKFISHTRSTSYRCCNGFFQTTFAEQLAYGERLQTSSHPNKVNQKPIAACISACQTKSGQETCTRAFLEAIMKARAVIDRSFFAKSRPELTEGCLVEVRVSQSGLHPGLGLNWGQHSTA